MATAESVITAKETMLGDLMKLVTDELKQMPEVWQKLSYDKQQRIIERVQTRVGDAVRECVKIIAAEARPTITANLEQVTSKDGIKAVLKVAAMDPNRHNLFDSVSMPVLLVVASSDEYQGGADKVQPESDQRAMDLNSTVVSSTDEADIEKANEAADVTEGEFTEVPNGLPAPDADKDAA